MYLQNVTISMKSADKTKHGVLVRSEESGHGWNNLLLLHVNIA